MKSSKANAYIKNVCRKMSGGGVSLLITLLLSFSLLFTACSNGDEDSNSNSTNNPSQTLPSDEDPNNTPSQTIPENQGKNPVDTVLGENGNENEEGTEKKSIKLNAVSFDGIDEEPEDCFFELETDGTATLYLYTSDTFNPYIEFKYTYNENQKEIYMKPERRHIEINDDNSIYTYDELLSPSSQFFLDFKEYYTKDLKKDLMSNYERNPSLQEEYSTYNDYEVAYLKKRGYTSFNELYEKSIQPEQIYNLRKEFNVSITYKYEIKNKKMILTEKFTGIKNMPYYPSSICYYEDNNIEIYIYNDNAHLYIHNDSENNNDTLEYSTEYLVPFDADKIIFHQYEYDKDENEKIIDTIKAPYKEDKEAVLLTVNGTKYTCNFCGYTYSQE